MILPYILSSSVLVIVVPRFRYFSTTDLVLVIERELMCLQLFFRITKLQVESLPVVSSGQLRVELQLLHGSRDLCDPLLSSGRVGRGAYSLSLGDKTLGFDIEIKDIPKVD